MTRINSLIAFFVFLGASLCAQEKLPFKGIMPINAYAFIPMNQINLNRFMEVKESGINLFIDNFPDIGSMKNALDLASKAGVKLLISCPELKNEP